jgi:DNA repair protein SbcD/Mre11
MKILHAADLHIDSPLRGLDRYEGAPVDQLRGATRKALTNLVDLALHEHVKLLLLAGDIFDGEWKDYSTGLFFAKEMARLRDAKIPVVAVRGNHDAASSVVKALRLPDNVKMLSFREPESFELRFTTGTGTGIVVHGQSFPQRVTTTDLALSYPPRIPGLFNIGLLHTSIDGRTGHEPYAPTSIETMRMKGYDYWALGHVHAREIVSTDPYIVYPGNLQGRHARETGAKGATLITVGDGNAIESVEHRVLDVLRWDVITIDASSAEDVHDVADMVKQELVLRGTELDDRILAARIIVTGSTRAHSAIVRDTDRFTNELRAAAIDGLGDNAWLEKIIIRTSAKIDLERVREEASAVGHLARRLIEIREDPKALAELGLEVFGEIDKRLPLEMREEPNALDLTDLSMLREMIDDVERVLIPRLLETTAPNSSSSSSSSSSNSTREK